MDEGLLSMVSAGWGQLVKMLITLEPHGTFGSNYAHLFILTLFSHLYAKFLRGFAEHHFSRLRSFSKNAHNS